MKEFPKHPSTEKPKIPKLARLITKLCILIAILVQFIKSKTSLISTLPPKLYIHKDDRLAFDTSTLVNSSMSVTQIYPSPTISQDSAELKVHDFTFRQDMSAAYNCIKTLSIYALEFVFICHSHAHIEKKFYQGDNWVNGNGKTAPEFLHAPTMIVLQRLRPNQESKTLTNRDGQLKVSGVEFFIDL